MGQAELSSADFISHNCNGLSCRDSDYVSEEGSPYTGVGQSGVLRLNQWEWKLVEMRNGKYARISKVNGLTCKASTIAVLMSQNSSALSIQLWPELCNWLIINVAERFPWTRTFSQGHSSHSSTSCPSRWSPATDPTVNSLIHTFNACLLKYSLILLAVSLLPNLQTQITRLCESHHFLVQLIISSNNSIE